MKNHFTYVFPENNFILRNSKDSRILSTDEGKKWIRTTKRIDNNNQQKEHQVLKKIKKVSKIKHMHSVPARR